VQVPGVFLVVTVIGVYAGFRIERVRPVRVAERGCQYDQLEPVEISTVTEATSGTDRKKPWQWVIAGMAISCTPVDGVNVEIGLAELL